MNPMMKRVLIALFAVSLATGIAFANEHGGSGGPGPDNGPGGNLLVGSDGTVYVTHTVVDTSTHTSTTTVTAIKSTGGTAWSATLPTNAGHLTLSGPNLIAVTRVRASDGTVTTTLTAISAATGATAWTKTINGEVTELTPFSGGTYAVVVVPPTTSGGTATRSLDAIGNDGSTLWSVAL